MNNIDRKLEAQVIRAAIDQKHKYDLASGLAGVLLMETYFYHRWPTEMRRKNIESMVALLIEALADEEMPVSLWNGLVGVAYALEFLTASCPDIVCPHVSEFIDDVDDLLLGYLENHGETRQYDLISGITGIGAYALTRTNRSAAKNLFVAVERELYRSLTDTGSGRTWFKRGLNRQTAALAAEPVIDLGIAHGAPGVVLLLCAGVRDKLITVGELPDLVNTLRRCQLPSPSYSKYGYFYPESKTEASRVAWCYGDLSIAFCFASAAEVLEDGELEAFSHDMISRRMAQTEASYEIYDNGLCHGYAGLHHLLVKLSKRDPRLLSNVRTVHQRLIRDRDLNSTYHCQPGLLDGMAGVLLAMNDGASRGQYHWDTCYSLGF